MLGCHDFCGYYEWTFHHVRTNFGQDAVRFLWSDAIGGDSQRAYLEAAQRDGLRGLLNVWTQTGEDEHCDWVFTLDEEKNVLRWDMRQCPSKGFLLDNNLNADEDYCDHCIGWIAPLLAKAGIEFAAHEHNHRGQCWGEMRVKGKPYTPLKLPIDIRTDERWHHGYIDHFDDTQKNSDVFERIGECKSVIADLNYANGDSADAVVLGDNESIIRPVASRYLESDAANRPLLIHAYFPRAHSIDFPQLGLPRPAPLLPILIRAGVYSHAADATLPSVEAQVQMLVAAMQKS